MNKDSFFNRNILGSKLLCFIGKISYSFYIWHQGILLLFHLNKWISVGVTAIAILVYQFEDKIRVSKNPLTVPLILGFGFILLAAACSIRFLWFYIFSSFIILHMIILPQASWQRLNNEWIASSMSLKQSIGRFSYSIYMWHFGIVLLMGKKQMPHLAIAVAIIGVLTYPIENMFREYKHPYTVPSILAFGFIHLAIAFTVWLSLYMSLL